MVLVEKAKRGIAAYLDAELMPNLAVKSWERIVVGGAISIAVSKAEKIIDKYKSNPMVEALEIFGSDGSVDVDLLKDTLKAQISKEGCMEISSIPIVGKLTFRSDDVDKVYDYIMKG